MLTALAEAALSLCLMALTLLGVATAIGEIRIAPCLGGEIEQPMSRPSIGDAVLARCPPIEVGQNKQRVKTLGIWWVSVADVRCRLYC